jgi:hypothetical protein
MAGSSVEIVNGALVRLGQNLITQLSESPNLNALYLPTLDARIRMHNWNCFTLRAQLQELDDNPLFGWDHMFQLPQDPLCLDVLSVNETETETDPDVKWVVESYQTASASYRVIMTDETSVNLKYLARITDVLRWDPLFAEAMSVDLAYQACIPITSNVSLKQVLQNEAKEAWRLAKSRDGQEGRPLKKVLSNVLITPRL